MVKNSFIEERKEEFRRSAHTALYAEHKQLYDRVLWEETKRWLSESHGMIPGLDDYIEIFCQYIADNTDPYQLDKLQILTIRKNIFKEVKDCFFNELDLEVQVTYSFVRPIISNGQCDVMNTKIGDNGKLELLKGKFVFQGDNVQSYASAMIAHEFTHAYEDYMRLKNGKKGLFDVASENGYHNAKKFQTSNELLSYYLSNILHYLEKFEVNAYANTIYGELKNSNFRTVDDGLKMVENMSVYKNYLTIGHWLGEMRKIQYVGERNYLIHLYITLRSITDPKEIEGLTYRKIMSRLSSSYTRNWRKFRKTVGKMIADIVTERGQVLDFGVNTNTLL